MVIDANEWKRGMGVHAPRGERETQTAPSARAPKWTVEESECVAMAFADCKGSALRFVALYNEVTEGKQRTAADLYYQLQRVAEDRKIDVPPAFVSALDDVIDGKTAAVAVPAPPVAAFRVADLPDEPEDEERYDHDEDYATPVAQRGLTVMALCHCYQWGRWYFDLESRHGITGEAIPMVCYRFGERPMESDYWITIDRIDESDWVDHVRHKHWSEAAHTNLGIALCEVREWRDRIIEWARPEIERRSKRQQKSPRGRTPSR